MLKQNERKLQNYSHVAPIHADSMGWASPLLMGVNPPASKKAPPQPAMVPQKIGPKIGKSNSEGAIAFPAGMVILHTT